MPVLFVESAVPSSASMQVWAKRGEPVAVVAPVYLELFSMDAGQACRARVGVLIARDVVVHLT
jgi:hypothetical protein